MKTFLQKLLVMSSLLVAAINTPSLAQAPAQLSGSPPLSGAQPGLILRGSDVIGAKVFSLQGEEVGHIRDVLLDSKTGSISYAVLGMGGWQGIGEKLAIVPWQTVKQDELKPKNYILQADHEKLKAAPSFERDQWATAIQPEYLAKVQKYYMASSPVQPQLPAPAAGTAQKPSEPAGSRQAEDRSRKESRRQSSGSQRSGAKEKSRINKEEGSQSENGK